MRMADLIEFAFAPELEALSPHMWSARCASVRGMGTKERGALCGRPLKAVRPTRNSSLVDPVFFEVFDFPLLLGDARPRRWPSATPSC